MLRRLTTQILRTTPRISTRSKATLTLPPRLQPSQSHHNLTTFLAYATRTALSPLSSVYKGTLYEYTVLDTLTSHLQCTLSRIGQKDDKGIDLLGYMTLPSGKHVKVIVQCKAGTTPARPSMVRELEGAFNGAPAEWDGEDAVALLVCGGEMTKGVREAVRGSRRAVGCLQVGSEDGVMRLFLWNAAADRVGLEELGVVAVRGGLEKEVAVTRKGEPWRTTWGSG